MKPDDSSRAAGAEGQATETPVVTPGWFDRPGNVRKIELGLYGACILFVLIDVGLWVARFDKHPYFEWQRWPGFQAVYAFVSCVGLVFLAKYVWRPLVMRRENYYEEEAGQEGASRPAKEDARDA